MHSTSVTAVTEDRNDVVNVQSHATKPLKVDSSETNTKMAQLKEQNEDLEQA